MTRKVGALVVTVGMFASPAAKEGGVGAVARSRGGVSILKKHSIDLASEEETQAERLRQKNLEYRNYSPSCSIQ